MFFAFSISYLVLRFLLSSYDELKLTVPSSILFELTIRFQFGFQFDLSHLILPSPALSLLFSSLPTIQSQDWTWLSHLDLTTDKTKYVPPVHAMSVLNFLSELFIVIDPEFSVIFYLSIILFSIDFI